MIGSICLVSHGKDNGGILPNTFRSLGILKFINGNYTEITIWAEEINSCVDFSYRNEDQYIILKEKE